MIKTLKNIIKPVIKFVEFSKKLDENHDFGGAQDHHTNTMMAL